MTADSSTRCGWANGSELMAAYHDTEWGSPQHDDRILFEYVILDSFQAGLSWSCILNKREGFRNAFADFDVEVVSRFGEADVTRLLGDASIIRHRGKIQAAIDGAQAFIKLQEEYGSFDEYIWQFVSGKPITNHFQVMGEVPAVSPESEAMSKDLRKRGFKFVGPTICYAFMQGAGLVNDHLVTCFRHQEVQTK